MLSASCPCIIPCAQIVTRFLSCIKNRFFIAFLEFLGDLIFSRKKFEIYSPPVTIHHTTQCHAFEPSDCARAASTQRLRISSCPWHCSSRLETSKIQYIPPPKLLKKKKNTFFIAVLRFRAISKKILFFMFFFLKFDHNKLATIWEPKKTTALSCLKLRVERLETLLWKLHSNSSSRIIDWSSKKKL